MLIKKKIEILKKQLEYTIKNSHFYRLKLKETPTLTRGFRDIKYLPFTTKKELLDDQDNWPPFGSNLCIAKNKITRIHKTSGTTNKPLIIALSSGDINVTTRIGADCFKSAGLKKTDVVIHCLNYNMWAGGYTDHQSLESTGAAVIPYGVGNSHNLISIILQLKPTAIHCTPSYLKKLEIIIRNDFKIEPFELSLQLGLFGAESGLQNPFFRKTIEATWGLKAMNANYGLSDVLSMFGAECKFQKGLHFWGLPVLFPELIDINTNNTMSIENGSVGELVVTNLIKEAQPLIRYKTNDVIKILYVGKCECGYNGFTFDVVGRSDDMLVIKGVNVFVSAIEKLLSEFKEFNVGIFQIEVNKFDPIDKVVISIEIKNNIEINKKYLINSIEDKIQKQFSFRPKVILLSEGQLKRTDGKSKKVLRTL